MSARSDRSTEPERRATPARPPHEITTDFAERQSIFAAVGSRRFASVRVAWPIGLFAAQIALPAEAAGLRWQAPRECDRAAYVAEQVEGLVGQKLESVDELEFDVTVTGQRDGTFELLLVTRTQGESEPGKRSFVAQTCAAVADAAAVAIAMTIRGTHPQANDAPAPAEPATTLPAEPTPTPAAPPAPRPAEPEIRTKTAALVALGGVVDTAALPAVAFGVAATAAIRRSSFRVEIAGTLLPSSTADLGDGRTGRFSLIAGAALICLDRTLEKFATLGCVGYELGSISGAGSGVSSPDEGSALWQAVRLEVGGGVAVSDGFRLLARLGGAIPTTRREFELAGVVVHEIPALSLRAAIFAELEL
jgi:hypothetical protein